MDVPKWWALWLVHYCYLLILTLWFVRVKIWGLVAELAMVSVKGWAEGWGVALAVALAGVSAVLLDVV